MWTLLVRGPMPGTRSPDAPRVTWQGRTVDGVTEQQPYEVLEQRDGFEVRCYSPHLLAQVEIDGSFEDAGNLAFRALFRYITGNNQSQRVVNMTAPVVQHHARTEEIAMTAPVVQVETTKGRHVVAFILPASMTLETAPLPWTRTFRCALYPSGWLRTSLFGSVDPVLVPAKPQHLGSCCCGGRIRTCGGAAVRPRSPRTPAHCHACTCDQRRRCGRSGMPSRSGTDQRVVSLGRLPRPGGPGSHRPTADRATRPRYRRNGGRRPRPIP